jgi:drug/metabolite transporter (DMT)-like permease
MNSERARIVFGFIIISVIWGSTWMFIKIGLQSIPPIFGVLLRFLLAAGILYVIIKIKRIDLPWDKTAVFLYATLGAISFSIPYILVYWGEQHIASGLAALLFGAYPFVVAVGSHCFIPAERLNAGKITGVILGFVGIAIIFWGDFSADEAGIFGMLALLASAVMQGISLVIVKRANHPLNSLSLTLGGLIFSLIILVPLAFIFEDASELRFDIAGIGSIIYLSIIGTALALAIYYWLVRKIEILYLSLTSFITPVVAVILGTLFLDEKLSARIFIGGLSVLLGILAANGELMNLRKLRKHLPASDG